MQYVAFQFGNPRPTTLRSHDPDPIEARVYAGRLIMAEKMKKTFDTPAQVLARTRMSFPADVAQRFGDYEHLWRFAAFLTVFLVSYRSNVGIYRRTSFCSPDLTFWIDLRASVRVARSNGPVLLTKGAASWLRPIASCPATSRVHSFPWIR